MNSALGQHKQTVLEVLNKMTFACGVESCLDDLPEDFAPVRRATIAFRGPRSGKVIMWATGEYLEEVAETLCGDGEAWDDVFGEIINVVTGRMLASNGGEALVFDLGTPIVSPVSSTEWNNTDLKELGCEVVLVDGEPLLFTVQVAVDE